MEGQQVEAEGGAKAFPSLDLIVKHAFFPANNKLLSFNTKESISFHFAVSLLNSNSWHNHPSWRTELNSYGRHMDKLISLFEVIQAIISLVVFSLTLPYFTFYSIL